MMIILGSKGAKQFKIFFSFFFLMNMWYVSLHREKISRYNICINCFFFSVHSKIHYLNCHQTRNTIKRFFILKLQIYIYISWSMLKFDYTFIILFSQCFPHTYLLVNLWKTNISQSVFITIKNGWPLLIHCTQHTSGCISIMIKFHHWSFMCFHDKCD